MKTLRIILVSLAFVFLEGALFASPPPGQVIEWGQNLGGGATGFPFPEYYNCTGRVAIAGHPLSNAIAIAAGCAHGLAIRSNGTVTGWGWNVAGQATGIKSVVSPDNLESDKTNGVVTFGGKVLSNVIAVAAGRGYSLALYGDGTVVAWGATDEGDADKVPPRLTNAIAIAAGPDYSLALKREGTVVGWGIREPPAGLSNVVAIAAGAWPSLALRKDGTVVEWAPGVDFEKGNVVASNAVAIAAGEDHALALRRDGTVFGWGFNGVGGATGVPTETGNYQSSGLVTIDGQTLSNVTAIAAGKGYSLALMKDGTVVGWGRMNNGLRPATPPPGLSNVVAIAAGDNFCLAITTNSAVADRFRQK